MEAYSASPQKQECDAYLALLMPAGEQASLPKHKEDSETATSFFKVRASLQLSPSGSHSLGEAMESLARRP